MALIAFSRKFGRVFRLHLTKSRNSVYDCDDCVEYCGAYLCVSDYRCHAAGASLLNNFEIVATAIIALVAFKNALVSGYG